MRWRALFRPRRDAGMALPAAMVRGLAAFLLPLLILLSGPPAAAQDDAGPAAGIEDLEPVDINDASVSDLLEIPGMDPDLARAIVNFRLESGPLDSVEALQASPSITPARLLAVRPWLTAEKGRHRLYAHLAAAVRSTSLPVPRQDFKLGAGRGPVHLGLRWKRGLPPDDGGSTSGLAGVLRTRPAGWLTLHAGDMAPTSGFGVLVGVTSRPPLRGAAAVPDPEPWPAASDPADLRRSVPAPEGRRLRGVAAAFGRHAAAGAFTYEAGTTAASGDAETETRPPRVLYSETSLAGARAALALYDGRPWTGLFLARPLAGGRAGLELARDPANRFRVALAAEGRDGRRFRFRLSHRGGSHRFVNPLGFDSERAPLSGPGIESGRNENRDETALWTRLTPVRRLALEFEVRGALEPSTSRRAWDRAVGTGIARLEASPGGGWSVATETRIENRGSPGPSSEAEAPLRRHAAGLRLAWQRGGAHVRLEWQGRLEFDVPPSGTAAAAVGRVQDLVAARARWPILSWLWLGGGVANYRLPSDAPAVLYEERPTGLPPGLFVRGAEERYHLAFGFRLGGIEGGGFVARRAGIVSGGAAETSWGGLLLVESPGGP